jgi:hypothetical protein
LLKNLYWHSAEKIFSPSPLDWLSFAGAGFTLVAHDVSGYEERAAAPAPLSLNRPDIERQLGTSVRVLKTAIRLDGIGPGYGAERPKSGHTRKGFQCAREREPVL